MLNLIRGYVVNWISLLTFCMSEIFENKTLGRKDQKENLLNLEKDLAMTRHHYQNKNLFQSPVKSNQTLLLWMWTLPVHCKMLTQCPLCSKFCKWKAAGDQANRYMWDLINSIVTSRPWKYIFFQEILVEYLLWFRHQQLWI